MRNPLLTLSEKWVGAKDRTVCSANDKTFQPKSSIFDLPQFVAFIMFDILQTEEPTIGLGICYSSDCRISKEIPHIVCFLPYLDLTIWGILSRFENQAFLRLQVFRKNSLLCRIYLKLNPTIWGIWIESSLFLRL